MSKREPITIASALKYGIKAAANKISEQAKLGRIASKEEVGKHVGQVLLATAADAIADHPEEETEKAPDTERNAPSIDVEGKEVI